MKSVKRLSFDGEFFWFKCAFEDRELPKKAGFFFERGKGFYTLSPKTAVRLREYADETARKKLSAVLIHHEPWTDRIPYPSDQTPKDFQLLSAKFLLSRNRAYAALDPGMGKTVVAALTMNALADQDLETDHHFVYICPPFLVEDVKAKIAPWRFHRTEPEIIPDSMLLKILSPHALKEMRKKHEAIQKQLGLGHKSEMVLFVDEAHRFKNESAQRTKALFGYTRLGKKYPGIVDFFDRVYFLSGTPMPNRPMELYPILSKCAPETIRFMGKFDYGRRYCAGYQHNFGWDFSGASNVTELANRVMPTFMLRLNKKLLNLPPLTEEILVITEKTPPQIADFDARILKTHSPEDLMKSQFGEEDLHLSTYRRLLGSAKVKPALPIIQNILEDGGDESIILIAIHKEVIAGLKLALQAHQPLVIDGSIPPKDRPGIAREFQTNKDRRVIILNAQAGGTGFDLTKATRVMFIEFTWVPGDNDQARDRAHRFGQKNPVLCQFLVYKNSIDRVVLEAIFQKKKSISQI